MKYLSISLLFLIAMCQKDDEETCLIDQPDLNVSMHRNLSTCMWL